LILKKTKHTKGIYKQTNINQCYYFKSSLVDDEQISFYSIIIMILPSLSFFLSKKQQKSKQKYDVRA